jgi:hypothetical protein
MKKFNVYILRNVDFLHGIFAAVQWIFLLVAFAFNDNNSLKKDWLDNAFILSGIGYLSFFIFPIFVLQCKLFLREKTENFLHGMIIILFYSEIIFIFHFLIIVVFSRKEPLFCFANTGIIFIFSCFEKIIGRTLRANNKKGT